MSPERPAPGDRRAAGGVLVDLLEDLFTLDGTITCDRLERHGHIILTNGLTARTTKVYGELFRVLLDNASDCKAC